MYATVTKDFRTETAHWLEQHEGKCRYLHGHSYLFKISVTGNVLTQKCSLGIPGMVLDFSVLKQSAERTILRFDHATLAPWTTEEYKKLLYLNKELGHVFNQKLFCCGQDPTAEFLAMIAAHSMAEAIQYQGYDCTFLYSITAEVFETVNSSAFYQTKFHSESSMNGLLHPLWSSL